MRRYTQFLALMLLCVAAAWAAASSAAAFELQSAEKEAALKSARFDLKNKADYVPGEVLVKFRNGAKAADSSALAATLGTEVASKMGAIGLKRFHLPAGVTVREAVALMADDPGVEYIEPNYLFHTTATPNDPNFNIQWGLNNSGQVVNGTAGSAGVDIRAVPAWDIVRGNGSVVIAVIDSGADIYHPDIRPNLWVNSGELGGTSLENWSPNGLDDDGNGYVDDIFGWDFVFNVNDPRDLYSGHGSHVSGIAAGVGNNGVGISGVAWRTKIMPLAVQEYNTGGLPTSAIIEAILYAENMGAHVINMSFGLNQYQQAMEDAVNAVSRAVICAAAGNEGRDNDTVPHYPSNFTSGNLIAVAAFDQNGNIAGFSNYGATTVDVSAPGVNILSTVPGGGYGYLDGTSQATPFVSGLAALLKSQDGSLGPGQIVSAIINGSTAKESSPANNGKPIVGGRINAVRSLTGTVGGDSGGDDGGGGCFIEHLLKGPAAGSAR